VIPYTVQYSPTEYADGRVTYRARLMLENKVPILISDAGHKTEQDALVGLASKYITQILDDPYSLKTGPCDPNFVPQSKLPSRLSEMVDDMLTHNCSRGTQTKIRARIRRREKQSLKERTV
jgi:hypothetical protein